VSEALMISAEQKKRARNVGYGYLGLAVITLVIFSRRPGDAGFRLTEGGFSLTLPAQQFALRHCLCWPGCGAVMAWVRQGFKHRFGTCYCDVRDEFLVLGNFG
jgi:hypothetical protein